MDTHKTIFSLKIIIVVALLAYACSTDDPQVADPRKTPKTTQPKPPVEEFTDAPDDDSDYNEESETNTNGDNDYISTPTQPSVQPSVQQEGGGYYLPGQSHTTKDLSEFHSPTKESTDDFFSSAENTSTAMSRTEVDYSDTNFPVTTMSFHASQKHIKHTNVLWVIDNRPSMLHKDLYSVAGDQMKSFVKSYARDSHVNIGIITSVKSKQSCVPSPAPKHDYPSRKKYNWKNTFTWGKVKVFDCQVNSLTPLIVLTHLMQKGMLANIKASSFFKPQAYTVLIIVTNDYALSVHAKAFAKAAKETFSAMMMGFYGFSPKDAVQGTNPCKNLYTNRYSQLSKTFHGRQYDICQENWSQNYHSIMQQAKAIQERTFLLDNMPQSMLSFEGIRVDGKPVSKDDYTLTHENHGSQSFWRLQFARTVPLQTSSKIDLVIRKKH